MHQRFNLLANEYRLRGVHEYKHQMRHKKVCQQLQVLQEQFERNREYQQHMRAAEERRHLAIARTYDNILHNQQRKRLIKKQLEDVGPTLETRRLDLLQQNLDNPHDKISARLQTSAERRRHNLKQQYTTLQDALGRLEDVRQRQIQTKRQKYREYRRQQSEHVNERLVHLEQIYG